MKFKALLIAALVITMIAIAPGSLVLAQNFTDSHLAINMTGVNASYLVIGQGGVVNSSRVIATTLVEIELTGVRMYPISCDFGLLRPGDVKYTGLAFEILNATNLTLDVTIGVTGDWAGSTNWTHSDDCIPGVDIAGMIAIVQGASSHTAIIVKKTAPYNYIVAGLAPRQTITFGLQLYAPTSFTEWSRKANAIFITTEES